MITLEINKQAVAASFSKAATCYDEFAQFQRDVGHNLLNEVLKKSLQPYSILDLGCGTGYFTTYLRAQFPIASITCFDLSNAMLTQVKEREIKDVRCQLGDLDHLPFQNEEFDFIFSNLAIQWSNDICACLMQVKSSLKNNGEFHFSTLLDGTLLELTEAWKMVDNNAHTNTFLTRTQLQKAIKSTGFSSVELCVIPHVLYYSNVLELMRSLKGVGANHVHQGDQSKITGRATLKKLEIGYAPFINYQGLLPLTYQVCNVILNK